MSAQDILNKIDERRPNTGLKLRDIEAFLANTANVRAMEGKTIEQKADYICTVLLDSAVY